MELIKKLEECQLGIRIPADLMNEIGHAVIDRKTTIKQAGADALRMWLDGGPPVRVDPREYKIPAKYREYFAKLAEIFSIGDALTIATMCKIIDLSHDSLISRKNG
jgi:hypothetical protein